jgi:DNA helicase-2/ATP-dependent DNA helicase PcrA
VTTIANQAKRETDFAVGNRVKHNQFGSGTVVSVDGDKVEVLFDGQPCSKPLMAGMAPMHKIG